MSWIEVLGFLTGALCVWLVVRRNIWNFPVGMANNVFFLVLFMQAGLYADAGLQIVYLWLAVIGWYWWLHGAAGHGPLHVTRTPRSALPWLVVGVVAMTAVMALLLASYTDSTVPLWDGLTTALSLTAQFMLNRKWIGNWLAWITADVLYIGLYGYKDLWLTSVLYGIFLAMCVAGYVQWRRVLELGESPNTPAQAASAA